jgi:hypothetical protein
MFRQVVAIALVALLVANAQALCPAFLRLVNAQVPTTETMDMLVNNNVVVSNLAYNSISNYVSVVPGTANIIIRQSGNQQQIATRSFVAVPNLAYTIAVTGTLNGPTGDLLYSSTPFVFQETIYPPNQGTFSGYFHRLAESSSALSFQVEVTGFSSSISTLTADVYNVQPKTAVKYQETDSGFLTSFSLVTSSNVVYRNSANLPVQLNTTTNSEILDFFFIGNDGTTGNPTNLQAVQTNVAFDASSGCTLVAGSTVYSDVSNQPVSSYQPYYCSASTIASGLAFLLALVALLL